MSSVYFIDFEAYSIGGELYPRELCIIEARAALFPLHFSISPPIHFDYLSGKDKTTNEYLQKHHHKLPWNENASVSLCESCIYTKLDDRNPTWRGDLFYVLDHPNGSKIQFLKEFFSQMRLTNYVSTLRALPPAPSNVSCPRGDHGEHCSYLKCVRMLRHYLNYMTKPLPPTPPNVVKVEKEYVVPIPPPYYRQNGVQPPSEGPAPLADGEEDAEEDYDTMC